MTDKLDDAALAAIKARHEAFVENTVKKLQALSPEAMRGYLQYPDQWEDRATLLAEVERLRAVERLLREQTALLREKAEADAAALRQLLERAATYVELCAVEDGGEEGAEAQHELEQIRAALACAGGGS